MRVVLVFLTFIVLSVCEIQDEFEVFKVRLNVNDEFRVFFKHLLILKCRKNIIGYTRMIVKKN